MGNQKLKTAVLLGVALIMQGFESTKDGFQVMDIFGFVDELSQLPEVIKSGAEMKAELDDLDLVERQDIYDAVKEKWNLDNERAENLAIAGLDIVFSIYNGVKVARA